MKGKMTTSRMGIMGSFLLSNLSLDVVTQSPRVFKLLRLPALYPAFSIMAREALRFSTISRVTSNSFNFF
jgi:hypothetical protein